MAPLVMVQAQPEPFDPRVSVVAGEDLLSGSAASEVSFLVVNGDDDDALSISDAILRFRVGAPPGLTFSTAPGANRFETGNGGWVASAHPRAVWFNSSDAGGGAPGLSTSLGEGEQGTAFVTLTTVQVSDEPLRDAWEFRFQGTSSDLTRSAVTRRWPFDLQDLAVQGPPGATDGVASGTTHALLRAPFRNAGGSTLTARIAPLGEGLTVGTPVPLSRTLSAGQTGSMLIPVTLGDGETATLRAHLTDADGVQVSRNATLSLLLEDPASFPSFLQSVSSFPLVLPQHDPPSPSTLRFNLTNAGEANATLSPPRLTLRTPLGLADITGQFDVHLVSAPSLVPGGLKRDVVYEVATTDRTTVTGDVFALLEARAEDVNVRNGTATLLSVLSPTAAITVDAADPLIKAVRVRPNPLLIPATEAPPVTVEVQATDEGVAAPDLHLEIQLFRLEGLEPLVTFTPTGSWSGDRFTALLDLANLTGLPAADLPGLYILAATAGDGAGRETTGTAELAVEDPTPPDIVEESLVLTPGRAFNYVGAEDRLNVSVDVGDNLRVLSVEATLVRRVATTPAVTELRVPLTEWRTDAGGTGTWTAVTPIRPGTYDLELSATDGASQARVTLPAHIVVRDTAPPVLRSLTANGATASTVNGVTALALRAVVEDDDEVGLVRATLVRPLAPQLAERVLSLTPLGGTVWGFELPAPLAIGEGEHLVLLSTRDVWGNYLNTTLDQALRLTVDTKPPSAPTPVSPADGTVLDAARVVFAWSRSDDAASNVTYHLVVTGEGRTIELETVKRIADVPLAEAAWTWRVEAVDEADNRASLDPQTVTVDRSVPELVTFPPLPGPVGTFAGLRVQARDISLVTLAYALDDGPLIEVTGGAGSLPLDDLAPGPHRLHLRAVDRAGHESEANYDFDLDPTLPSSALTSASVFAGPARLTFRAEDLGSGVATVWVQVGSQPPVAIAPTETFIIEAEGTHIVSYYAEDLAGNVEAPHIVTVRVDRTDPEMSGLLLTASTISVDVIEEGPLDVTAVFTRDRERFEVQLLDDGVPPDAAAADRRYTAALPDLERGRYDVAVEARDSAGNLVTQTAEHSEGGVPWIAVTVVTAVVAVGAGVAAFALRRRW